MIEIFDFANRFLTSILSLATDVFSLLSQEYGIGDFSFSLFELMFGAGFVVVLGVVIANFLNPLK